MEQIEPSENQSLKNNQSKRKNKLAFYGGLLIILIIFVSATSGAVFGFLASKSGTSILANLDHGKFKFLVAQKEIKKQPDIIKQKIIQEDSAVIDVVKKTTPAVVSIVISKDIPQTINFDNLPNFFGFGFGQNNQNNQNNQKETFKKQTIGGGTGFFITTDGMIVTNRHVVDDPNATYTVVTNDKKKHSAKVLAIDPVNDLAVIKIKGNGYPILSLGDSDKAQIGQTVIAIGNSLGQFSNTVSRGIISGLKRSVTAGGYIGQVEKLKNIIQTDAAINPGNSGGPLLNINGKVVGINVAIAQGAQNIGFAIPAKQVKKVVEEVKKTGKISTPYLGVRYIPVTKTLQKKYNLPYGYGSLVLRGNKITDLAVVPGSPADKAGIMENDIILEVDGKKVNASQDGDSLSDLIAEKNIGETVTLKIWHKGKNKTVQAKLTARE